MNKPEIANRFPHSPEEITVDWLNRVLREARVLDDDALESIQVSPTDEGFGAVGSHARLRLMYTQLLPGVPRTLFAKFSSVKPAVRASFHALRAYEREVGFYRDVAPIMSLRTPRCYFAELDPNTGHSLLLLEDLTGGRSGDSLAGCSTQDAELILKEIAVVHAEWWESPDLSRWTWLPRSDDDVAKLTKRFREAFPAFRERCASFIPPWAIDTAQRTVEQVPEIFHAISVRPATLTHGDLGLDNVRFDLPNAHLALYDWQLTLRAPGARDVAWFLVRSLPIAQRRAEENHLIGTYHESLVESGVDDYSLADLQRDVHLGWLRAFLSIISASANADFASGRGEDVLKARVSRNVSVLEDHDVWEALS